MVFTTESPLLYSNYYRLLSDTIGTDRVKLQTTGSTDVYNKLENLTTVQLDSTQYDNYLGQTATTMFSATGNVFPGSVAGTYICNIRKNVVPYGGYYYANRINNIYSSYGDYVKCHSNSS
mgnify:CR=1 FL=1